MAVLSFLLGIYRTVRSVFAAVALFVLLLVVYCTQNTLGC